METLKLMWPLLVFLTQIEMGNANGMNGESALGSLGYALVDAKYADKVVLVTDTIVDYPNTPASIQQNTSRLRCKS